MPGPEEDDHAASTGFLRSTPTLTPVRVIRCDCGFEASEDVEDELVARAQSHAREVHDMDLPVELLRALARRTEHPEANHENGSHPR